MTLDLARCMAIDGFTDEEELTWLASKAAQMQSVVEIGTWKGRSALALAMACPGRVYTIDTFEGSPSEWDSCHAEALEGHLYDDAVLNLRDVPNLWVIKEQSLAASRRFSRVDMVWIDGEHTTLAVLTDLIAWVPKAVKLVCGHDISFEGVVQATAVYGIPVEAGPGSIWYMEKMT